MSEDDVITLKEIDVSYLRDHVPPGRWPHHLLGQTIHTTRKLPGLRAKIALFFLKRSHQLLKGVNRA